MEVTCKSYHLLGEKVFSTTMDNGLHCIFLPKEGFKRKFAVLAVPCGSVHRKAIVDGREVSFPGGVAHFLEHKLFEDPAANVENRFARLGAGVNAFTNHTMTAYMFSTADNFSHCLDLLLEFVQQPAFSEQGVVDERNVIAQEIKMYTDQPYWAAYLGTLKKLYGSHPIAEDIAGKLEDLQRIDYQVLRECHRLFYHPSNMVLVVAGDMESSELFQHVAESQQSRAADQPPAVTQRIDQAGKQPIAVDEKREMEVARPLFNLGFRDAIPADWKEAVHKETVAGLLLEMMSGKNGDFYNRLYDQGLIDHSFALDYTTSPWYSHLIFGGESDRPDDVAEEIIAELTRWRKAGWDSSRVEQNRNKLIGHFVMELNSLETTVMACAADWLQGCDYFKRFEILQNAETKDLQKLLQALSLQQPCLYVVRPASGK